MSHVCSFQLATTIWWLIHPQWVGPRGLKLVCLHWYFDYMCVQCGHALYHVPKVSVQTIVSHPHGMNNLLKQHIGCHYLHYIYPRHHLHVWDGLANSTKVEYMYLQVHLVLKK